jgi:hypothetical protein
MADKSNQLTYDGLHATKYATYRLTRATVKKIPFTHDYSDNDDISEVRFFMRGPGTTTTAVVQLTLENNASQVDMTTDGECTITIDDDDTRGLELGIYKFGVEFVDDLGDEQAPITGTIELTDEVVHDDATAAYLSWTTRSTYDTNLDAILLCNEGTTLASDASASDGTITVTSVTPFSAGDDITIHDATNSETHTIAAGGISGSVITLDGTTLANAYLDDVTVVVKDF